MLAGAGIRAAARARPTLRRRKPQNTVLYQVLAEQSETSLSRVEEDDSRSPPRFVVRELDDFLRREILAADYAPPRTCCRKAREQQASGL